MMIRLNQTASEVYLPGVEKLAAAKQKQFFMHLNKTQTYTWIPKEGTLQKIIGQCDREIQYTTPIHWIHLSRVFDTC